jgi:hypothetical protein
MKRKSWYSPQSKFGLSGFEQASILNEALLSLSLALGCFEPSEASFEDKSGFFLVDAGAKCLNLKTAAIFYLQSLEKCAMCK